MPNVYKLQYASKASLESALLSRGILTENEEGEIVNAQGTHAVVHLGEITEGKYHADIMVEGEFSFGANEVNIAEGQPQAHKFA